jgi:hypothetical protein
MRKNPKEETDMKGHSFASGRWLLAPLAMGALLASFAAIGTARADTDNIVMTGQVNVDAIPSTCGTGFTETSFSFDISWVDPFVHAYFLADRTHGGTSNGDILMIDLSDSSHTVTPLTPPNGDPFAGIICDANNRLAARLRRGGMSSPAPTAFSPSITPKPGRVMDRHGSRCWDNRTRRLTMGTILATARSAFSISRPVSKPITSISMAASAPTKALSIRSINWCSSPILRNSR